MRVVATTRVIPVVAAEVQILSDQTRVVLQTDMTVGARMI